MRGTDAPARGVRRPPAPRRSIRSSRDRAAPAPSTPAAPEKEPAVRPPATHTSPLDAPRDETPCFVQRPPAPRRRERRPRRNVPGHKGRRHRRRDNQSLPTRALRGQLRPTPERDRWRQSDRSPRQTRPPNRLPEEP
ncbi:hypothetical protein ABI59_22305 [Acidobacteria bacterium Mor1]|nr:hypothetical protein ABI59_22305 [Acidobacteria bacterium Mor1]